MFMCAASQWARVNIDQDVSLGDLIQPGANLIIFSSPTTMSDPLQKKHRKHQKKEGKKQEDRFQPANYDPKFIAPTPNTTKVTIDHRFAKMMSDPEFMINSQVDRYGRNVPSQRKTKNRQLEEYYNLEHSQQQVQSQQSEQGRNRISNWMNDYDEQSSSEQQFDRDLKNQDQEEQDDSEDLWLQIAKVQAEQLEYESGAKRDRIAPMVKNQAVKASRRLALCNYDWMNISAKDLMLLFNSFKKQTGTIKSVKVYYSQFGKQQIQQEQTYGPKGVFKSSQQLQQSVRQPVKKSWKQLLQQMQSKINRQSSDDAFDQNKLRRYQVEKLKFCYAVIECGDKLTADDLYQQCDGTQFENSNLEFDLRFIADEMKMPEHMLKEECLEMPMHGEVKNFVNRASGHSKIGLTWDDPELNHISGLKKKNWNAMTDQDLENIDWGLYINEGEAKADSSYRKVMKVNASESGHEDSQQSPVVMSDWRKQANKSCRRKSDDISITFESGFGSAKNNQTQKQSLNSQIRRTKKERWSQKRQQRQQRKQDNQELSVTDRSAPKVNHAHQMRQQDRERVKLSMMVGSEEQEKNGFQYNPEDERFKAIFENPVYSIDPISSKFDHRKTGQAFKEVVRRNNNKKR